jgi:hypothetical protein
VYQQPIRLQLASTIYNSEKSIPDGERFLQVLNGRFLPFALISSVSPQNSSNIHAIY